VAIVTGAGRGIGRAIALELAAMGMRVALVARSRAELDAVRARIGDAALAVPTDVSQAGAVREMYETIRSSLGVPSVLVNSAGVYRYGLVAEASEADFDIVVGTNLKGTFATCRAVLPDMIAGGRGDIVNIASIAGKVGTSRRALYCASKFGVVGFTHALAEEVREHGIRATVICPGSTNTGFSPKDVEGKARDRMLQPEDIAHTVRMILSQRATSFMSEVVMRPTRKP
jgi:3-oxoacyl-[acyl-carrier protein] reductase